jgi:hypothetical protein
MEKMEGKTESLEMVNENNLSLIVEFKTLPFQLFLFLAPWKDGG